MALALHASHIGLTLLAPRCMPGLTRFLLLPARILLRLKFDAPAIIPQPPAWQQHRAKAMHVALYGFLFTMPLLGWLVLSAKGEAIPFFGASLPRFVGPDKTLVRSINDVHECIGALGY